MHSQDYSAHFGETYEDLVIERLTLRDKDVAREAQRWTTGERGAIIDDATHLASADLTNFAIEAIKIGAHALSATGQASESRALERMLKDVGEKAADSTTKAAELTDRAVKAASETVTKAADAAKKAITEADAASRREFTNAVAAAKKDMNAEVQRIFGGTSPELLERLQPVLEKFGVDLDAKVTAGTTDLLVKAAKQFDPSDPSSPMAKHAAELDVRQKLLTEAIEKNHTALAAKVDELTTALKVQEAKTTLAKVTPIKGETYANHVHQVLASVAAGLGDEYFDTSAVVGSVLRSKKGDGVLAADGGAARVVIEMTDSTRAGWAEYFDEAERNRQAVAALGLVRTAEQNGNQSIRVLGARRIVLAFDPAADDPELLRTVVMLLRTSALAASTRKGAHQVATAEEKIGEAIAQMEKIEDVKKTAGSIQKSATKIESACTGINSSIHRLLADALAALAEAAAESTVDRSAADVA